MPELHIEINEIDKAQPLKIFVEELQSFLHAVRIVFVNAERTTYPLPRENILNLADADCRKIFFLQSVENCFGRRLQRKIVAARRAFVIRKCSDKRAGDYPSDI